MCVYLHEILQQFFNSKFVVQMLESFSKNHMKVTLENTLNLVFRKT